MGYRRARFVGLALFTIGVGLFVHWRGAVLGPAARDVVGDALWAAMILWWVSAVAPSAGLVARCVAAYLVCAGVEVSQLYHAPALEAARATTLGQLVLGSGFDWRDLGAYAIGVVGAALVEAAAVTWMRRRSSAGVSG